MKKIIIALVALGLVGLGAYFFIQEKDSKIPKEKLIVTPVSTATTTTAKPIDKTRTIIGASVEKRDIVAYHYGTGSKEVLFVGGVHGGYEWNTALLAYELMDYLAANRAEIPTNVKVTVIPVLNPDGLYKVVGTSDQFNSFTDVSTDKETVIAGRFNANNVDLNRNFDCNWKEKGVWQTETVSGGTSAFSEPESQAFKKYIESKNPIAVVAWYSSAGGVFSSSCQSGVLPETKKLTNLYATASKYPASESYDFYKLTGDMVNWLAKKNIPAISVLLTTHQDIEWAKNLAGVKAVLANYAK